MKKDHTGNIQIVNVNTCSAKYIEAFRQWDVADNFVIVNSAIIDIDLNIQTLGVGKNNRFTSCCAFQLMSRQMSLIRGIFFTQQSHEVS
jgi:hypothetical protein